MRVALVHDHLAQDGGAEKVLKVFAEMFPSAPIYTLLYDKGVVEKNYKGKKIEASIIQRLPGGVRHYQWYMPFMPMAVEFFDLRGYDLVISDSSAFAKGVITSPETLHICYCHTPTRYLWDYAHQYINELKYNKYFKKIISLVLNYIRLWDKVAADRVDFYIANSKHVQERIKKYYRRDSTVIYPPVEIGQFSVSEKIGGYYLIGGRLAPYKRVDIVIEAFNKLNAPFVRGGEGGVKLKIFGDGVDMGRLKKLAAGNPNIEFLGRVDEKTKAELYRRCVAFLNPQEEDFGITVIEAMASGRPVIAYRKGGAVETIIEGETGEFFDRQTPEALAAVISDFNASKFDSRKIRQHAEKFSIERFKGEIRDFINKEWNESR
ncbi:glycosyltransferase [Candidatus Falkowbacteria bacterium]|nr:glycosyltransferase [Candidatus Falkowbacteria bacterium]